MLVIAGCGAGSRVLDRSAIVSEAAGLKLCLLIPDSPFSEAPCPPVSSCPLAPFVLADSQSHAPKMSQERVIKRS